MVRLAFVAERARCPGEALDLAGACCQWQMAHGKWQDGGAWPGGWVAGERCRGGQTRPCKSRGQVEG